MVARSDAGEGMSLWKRLAGAASDEESSVGNLLKAVGQRFALGRDKNEDNPEHQVAFTIGVIALGAKMAKADGVVTRDEVQAFKEVFKVPDGEMQNVSRIFDLAKQDIVGYETYADQLASLLKNNDKLLADVLEGLFHIAVADGVFHPNEELFLAEVARRFAFSDVEFSYIRARHTGSPKDDPYAVLGITPEISGEALKTHYRKLVAENHPDKMIARGVPPEFILMATKKLAAINAAYEAVTNT
jgi:DnaJ like chaperone protein